jgi:hypothetical protein
MERNRNDSPLFKTSYSETKVGPSPGKSTKEKTVPNYLERGGRVSIKGNDVLSISIKRRRWNSPIKNT